MDRKFHIAKCWHPFSQSNWYELRDQHDNCYEGSHNRQDCVERQKQLEQKEN